MTAAQRAVQVTRDFPTRPPAAASAEQVKALAAAPLCPVAAAASRALAAAPADYVGTSLPMLYNAAGRCVSGGTRIPTNEVVTPGETITVTAHIYYANRDFGGPVGTTRLPTRVSFKFTDCMNRVSTVAYPDPVQAIYQPSLSNAELQAWVEAHPNPISMTFTAPREGCVRRVDDSGWAKWAVNTTVEVTTTVVGGGAGRAIAGICVNGVAPDAAIGGNDLQPQRGDPVNSVTGAYTEAVTDLGNDGEGVPLAVARSYASDDTTVGLLGPGWTSPWLASASTTDSGATVTVRAENGARFSYLRNWNSTYLTPAGTRWVLASVAGGGWTWTAPDFHRLTFDAAGKLTAITDAAGRTQTLTYSGTTLSTVTDSAGAVATLTQTGGRLTVVTLADGRRVDYAYTGGRLTSATVAGAGPTTYAYDTAGRLASRTDALGNAGIRNTYDTAGKVISQLDALGNKTTFTYLADRTDVTDARGGIWTDVHGGNVVLATYDPSGAKTSVERDALFNPLSMTNPDGSKLVSSFDATGRPVKVARPSTETGTPNTLGYDAAGNVASYAHPDGGGVTNFTYTAQRQLATVKNPLGDITTYTYGAGGTLASAVTPAGRKTTFGYDRAGNRTETLTAAGGRATASYDPGGRVIQQRLYRDPVDLAAGRPVKASSVFAADFAAALAVDGKPTSRWSSAFADPQWFSVDLGAAQPVDRVRLNWEAAYASAYEIQVSTDETTWTTVHTTTTGRGGEEVVSFAPVTARYVRMSGTKRALSAGYSLWDLQVFHAAGRDFDATSYRYDPAGHVIEERQRGPESAGYRDQQITTHAYDTAGQLTHTRRARQIPTDLAAGRPVKASSVFASDYAAALAVDGRPTTRWSSEFSDPQWFSVDLGAAQPVDRVRLGWEAAYATAYQVQVSTDETTWTTVHSTTTGRGDEEVVSFAPVTARYVRMSGTKRALTAGYSLWDFEVYHTAGVAWDTTAFRYDAAGRLTEVTDPAGAKTMHTYDGNGNRTSMTDAAGAKTTYGYDAANRLTSQTSPRGNLPGATPGSYTSSYTYDANGNRKTETDPLGNVTTYGYDALGRLTSVKNPLGHQTTYTYDKNGNRRTETDPLGKVTTLVYDKGNRLASSTDRLGHVTTYGYDADGNLTSKTTAAGFRTSYLYDTDGRMVGEVDPRGNAPDARPTDFTTYYAHDAAGRVTTVTDPLGGQTRTGYDPVGNTTATTDAVGATTSYRHDPLGRLVSVTAPDAAVTSYEYDAGGRVARRVDGNGHTTGYGYDPAGRLTSVTDPLTRKIRYGYDADGNRTTVTNARGSVATTTFDPRNLATRVAYSDNTPAADYTFDAAGRAATITDATGTRTFGFDAANRLAAVTMPGAGGPKFAYTYDANGNIATRTYPNGRATTYGYDLDDRLTTQTTDALTTRFGYDPAGNLTSTTLPAGNGLAENRSYDRAGRLTGIGSRPATGTALDNFALALDPLGRLTKVTTSRAGLADQIRTFGYDAGGRLATECVAPTIEQDCQGGTLTTYGYDKVGNRLTRAVRGSATLTSTYDAADQLRTAGATSYDYDADGNQTAAGGDTFGYDAENRLITATSAGATHSYTYDATGNRVTTRKNGTVTRTSAWDLNNPLPVLATDTDAAGASTDSHPNPVGQPLWQRTAAGPFYLHHDWLGSVVDVTNATGVNQRRTSFNAWGVPASTTLTTTAPPNTFGFAGGLNDPDLPGRLVFPARAYIPDTGTFTSRDPQPYPTSKPYTSTYGYAEGAPTHHTDPSGRCAILCTVIAGGIIGGIVGGGVYAWQHRNDENFDWGGLAKASGKGALIGAGAGLLMPAAGAGAASFLGLEGGAAVATNIGVNAVVGAGYTYAVNTAQCQPTTPTDLFLGALGGAAAGVGGAITAGRAGSNVWQLEKFERGLAIEAQLGGNLPKNFPIIDRFANGVATSIKSVDLAAPTYQSSSRLASLLRGYVDKAAGFAQTKPVTLSSVTIRPAQVTSRELEVAIPKGSATAGQQQVLQDIVRYGATRNVTVRITEVR